MNDRLLRQSIEAHKKIITEGEAVDLASIGYEDGTPLDRVRDYNAFTILTKLNFSRDEAVNPKSDSAKYLDILAAGQISVEEIIEKLIAFRDQIVNS